MPILMTNDVRGKLYRCIRISMYKIVKARVKCGAQFTEYIIMSISIV